MSKKRQPPKENPLAGELAPPVERQYYSVAFICQMIQETPEYVHRLMKAAGVEFAWSENGIGVISGGDVVKMKQLRCAVQDEMAAAPFN